MKAALWNNRLCELGEGPLWHPERQELFWFDILGKKMYSKGQGSSSEWQFSEMHSAAGWVDHDSLLIASETALWIFDLSKGSRKHLVDLEADDIRTRSNDGRADPQGGFWIGTMGKNAEPGLGSIWRWYQGKLKRMFEDITISNAISFSPSGDYACFADTTKQMVMQVALDNQGWPKCEPEIFLDLRASNANPDGAVFDADGLLWTALWGAGRVSAFDESGEVVRSVFVDAPNASCPAFGGENGNTLFCTTARQGMTNEDLKLFPNSGSVFSLRGVAKGLHEHRVRL